MTASKKATSKAKASSNPFSQKLHLITALSRREIEGRYRGSGLGLIWSLITPLLMLGIYTFVFGVVFESKWATTTESNSPATFSVILFTGLILFQIFSETVNRAPALMMNNVSYVKKVVFPLEILVPVAVNTALFHAIISIFILLPFAYFVFGEIPVTALLVPIVVLPLVLYTLGISWFLAALGTYWRDIGQVTTTITTALLFLAPIFFPLTAMPEWVQPFLILNPITLPVEQVREVLLFGNLPDFLALGIYSFVGVIICLFGYSWFQLTRKGFADVL